MLETVGEFGLERLVDAGEDAVVRAAHASYFAALARQAEPHLDRTVSPGWLDRLEREHDNLRLALGWLWQRGAGRELLDMAGALWWFWYYRSHLSEGRSWLERALATGEPRAGPARAKGLMGLGTIAHFAGDDEAAVAAVAQGLALWRETGDDFGTAYSLTVLGIVAEDRGDYDGAAERFREALDLFRRLADTVDEAIVLYHLAVVAFGRGDLREADVRCEESLALSRTLDDPWSVAMALGQRGLVAYARGDDGAAASLVRESLSLFAGLGSTRAIADCLAKVATLAAHGGRAEEAARLFAASDALMRTVGAVHTLPERTIYDRARAVAQNRLDESTFAHAVEAGDTLPVDRAVADALALAENLAGESTSPPVSPSLDQGRG
jgi:tetratricopeptide (TPR) repeat protein